MSDATNKSDASAASGTTIGNNNFFRRKKIIPAVVARKIGNSTSTKSNKTATTIVKVDPANVVTHNETVNSIINVPAAPGPILSVVSEGNTQEKTMPEDEVCKIVTAHEVPKQVPSSTPPPPSKPATAFRRIKPKVAILPQLKPAKSILKKTNAPINEASSSSTESTIRIAAEKEEKLAVPVPDSESAAAKDDARQEDKEEVHTNIPDAATKLTSHCTHSSKELVELKQVSDVVDGENDLMHPAQSVQGATNEDVTNMGSTEKDNAVAGDRTVEQENISLSDENASTVVRIDNAPPPVLTSSTQVEEKKSISEGGSLTEKSTTLIVASAGTKTIKRTIPLGKLSADLTNLLKSHIKKKGKTLPAKGTCIEAAVSKEMQENQENQKVVLNSSNVPTPPSLAALQCVGKELELMAVEPNKAFNETDPASGEADKSASKERQLINELPVTDSLPDNVPKQQTIVTKIMPPSPAMPPQSPPVPTEASATGQTFGMKKIQKVHKLTNETKLLLMNSLMKGKTKSSVKTPSVNSATNSNVTIPTPQTTEVSESATVKKPCPVKDERKVNIISSVVLPRLFNVSGQSQSTQSVSSFGAPQQHIYTFSDSSAVISIPNASSSSTVAQPQVQSSGSSTSDSSSQYPKVFIIGHDVNSTFATVPSTVPLPKPYVSVTVLPQANPSCLQNISSPPSRPVYLPPPVVTIRPTFPLNASYASPAPPSLPTPIVSVTMKPANGSNSLECTRMDVPVDPRIVPKIVIDGCDTIDPDSQSSLSSTSSSSSSIGPDAGSRNQFSERRGPLKLKGKEQPEVSKRGCSSTTLTMLRAKMMQKMKQRNEQNLSLPNPEPPKKMLQHFGNTYGKQKNSKVSKNNNESVPEIPITITVEKTTVSTARQEQVPNTFNKNWFSASNDAQRNILNFETKDVCNILTKHESKNSSDVRPELAKSCSEQRFLEPNEFCGFSNASIETAEQDFKDRARTIDSVLQMTRNAPEVKSTEEGEQSVSNDVSNHDLLASPLTTTIRECSEADDRHTFTNILAVCSETRSPDATQLPKVKNAETEATTSTIAVSDANEENVPAAASFALSNTVVEEPVVDLESEQEEQQHQNYSEEESQDVGFDNVCIEQVVSNGSNVQREAKCCDNNQLNAEIQAAEKENNITNDEILNIVPEESGLISTDNAEEHEEGPHLVPDVDNISIPVLEHHTRNVSDDPKLTSSEMTEEQKEEVPPSVEALPTSVPELSDQEATGVDFIIAMAKMRRENRVMSVDEFSDEDELEQMKEDLLATPETPAQVSSSSGGRKQKSKQKRKRRKKRRDKFVDLLLKHVNYESLIAEILQQEQQHFNYVSSTSEADEERSLSPLERYIRVQERERQQEQEKFEIKTDDFTVSSDESLVEEKILSIFLNKGSPVCSRTSSSGECNSTRPQATSSGSSTSISGILARQSEEPTVQRSYICDRSAEQAAEGIKQKEKLPNLDNDVVVHPEGGSFGCPVDLIGIIDNEIKREHDTTCDNSDTASETNVKQFNVSTACANTGTCDNTTSHAAVDKRPIEVSFPLSTAIDTINTQTDFATKEPIQQEQHLAAGRRGKKKAPKRPAKSTAGRRMQKKRVKLNAQTVTPPVVIPPFDSSDAPNNEVVSDCSTDGLSSTVEAVVVNKEKPLKAINSSRDEANGSIGNTTTSPVQRLVARQRTEAIDVDKEDSFQRSGRRKKSGRNSRCRSSSSSSSSSNNSSQLGINTASGGEDHSSSGEPSTTKRRRLRRKKRSSLRVRSNLALKTLAVTVDCSTDDPSVSSTARGSTTDMSSHLSSTASKHSKASSTDAAPTYVISEISASEEEIATPRPRVMIRVRNSRALLASPPPEPVEEQLQQGQKRGRGRGAPAKQTPTNGTTTNESIVPELTNLDADVDPEQQLVKCGHCGTSIVPEVWQEHYNFHNGATYRVGIDEPFDLKDVKALSAVIQRFMKVQRRVEVACERCGEVKKSGGGMASHLQTCGLSKHELEQSKASCPHCGRKMKAISMTVHLLQHCKVLKQQQQQQQSQAVANTTASKDEKTASGRMKRKSVTTAERLIKKLTKEINEESMGDELVRKIAGEGLTHYIVQCLSKHLQQSTVGVCDRKGCAFFGMTPENMRKEHSYQEDGRDTKPLYQCVKCLHMSASQNAIYEHIRLVHPDLVRKAALQHPGIFGSDGDSDAYVASGNGSTSDDTYSSALEEEMDGKAKKGKGKKQSNVSNKSKSKKSGEGGGSGKKSTAKQTGGSKANASELLDGAIASTTNEETEVYKEMVFQESVDYKADKVNYHLISVKWTHQFRRDHYTARLLFSDLRPDVDTSFLRSLHDLHSYLPKTIRSMRFVQCNSKLYDPGYTADSFTNRWQQMSTFEGEALGCEQIFFTGGPVVSLDWLPLPDEASDSDQFLAIACKQTYDEYYSCEELSVPQPRKCLIQIWNVGPLQNPGLSKITARSPQLAFAIPCDFGPIWQIAFCPSGCYNDVTQGDDFDRLGLLAVAGSDGDVHVYALSRSVAVSQEDTKPGTPPKILPHRPVMLLSLSLTPPSHDGPASDFTGRSVLRIAWSREKGHNVLAAGYSNGVVAVWNLAAQSPLLCGTKEGIRTLLPVHRILHSSSSSITALDLHYSTGTRFLVVCNADRRLKMYDLRCGLYQPLESLSTIVRSRMPALRWLLHFPVLVIAYDDALCIDRCAYTVHQPREIGLRMFGIFTLGSEMTDLGTNDWLSMNAVSTSGGDLVCHRPVPFVYGMNYKKLAQVLTTTISMKLKAEDDSTDVSRYDAFAEEFGLLFSDTDKVPTAMDTAALHLKTWRRGKLGHYPAVRLNQIRWNPNSASYSYYAIGYQAGFVRVRVLRT